MFLFQKLKYNRSEDASQMLSDFLEQKPNYVVYDTETTGLDHMKDTAFILSVGFNKNVYVFETTEPNLRLFEEVAKKSRMLLAHNAKYDYHMMLNTGVDLSDCNLGDSMTIARLTSYADEKQSLSLEHLGEVYVDDSAKFAGKVIKKHINDINKIRRKELREYIKLNYGKEYKQILEAYDNRVQFVPSKYDVVLSELDTIYKEPTYYDSYLEKPDLMKAYALDDVVIMLEYLKKSLPILAQVDPDLKTFKREGKLIVQTGQMERVGLKADVDYLLRSRETVLNYKERKYQELWDLVGREFSVGQHQVIKDIFRVKYNIVLESTGEDALTKLSTITSHEEPAELASMILELRHVEKLVTTYIDGMLNRIKDDKVYTSIKLTGAVSGRVSSDMQQQPKEAKLDSSGNELFHPRRVFVNEEGYKMYYFDYSQMELRLQAQYTVQVAGGDMNLCRAYMPFECTSMLTGDKYDTRKDRDFWDSGEWLDESGNPWEPVDLHSTTTHKAFPEVEVGSDEFKKLRKYGKIANFLKNYMGGVDAIMEQLGVDRKTAEALDNGYYEAFPVVKDYQAWVNSELTRQGYVENIYGRRYYMQDSRWFYKATNYVIQGGCADMVKQKQLEVFNFLKENNYKSKIVLPVHDEIQVMVANGEENIVPIIKSIMQDTQEVMPDVPMICDVEVTDTNWAEKYEVE